VVGIGKILVHSVLNNAKQSLNKDVSQKRPKGGFYFLTLSQRHLSQCHRIKHVLVKAPSRIELKARFQEWSHCTWVLRPVFPPGLVLNINLI